MCPNHIQVMKEIEREKEKTNVYTQNTLIQTHLHVNSFTYIILRQNIRVCFQEYLNHIRITFVGSMEKRCHAILTSLSQSYELFYKIVPFNSNVWHDLSDHTMIHKDLMIANEN